MEFIMKINEIILHEFLIQLKTGTKIFRNPLKPVIFNLFKETGQKAIEQGVSSINAKLRGLIISNKIYIWNSWDGMHGETARRLKSEGYTDEEYTYTGFYLRLGYGSSASERYVLESDIYHKGGATEANVAVLNKFLDRWNS